MKFVFLTKGDFEVAVKRTVELAKKLSVKIRMKKLNEDFK